MEAKLHFRFALTMRFSKLVKTFCTLDVNPCARLYQILHYVVI
jgi:hypothetical protein